jgi:hypothetical protein
LIVSGDPRSVPSLDFIADETSLLWKFTRRIDERSRSFAPAEIAFPEILVRDVLVRQVHCAVFSKEYSAVPGTPVSRADPSGRPAPDPNTISHRGIIQVINAASEKSPTPLTNLAPTLLLKGLSKLVRRAPASTLILS